MRLYVSRRSLVKGELLLERRLEATVEVTDCAAELTHKRIPRRLPKKRAPRAWRLRGQSRIRSNFSQVLMELRLAMSAELPPFSAVTIWLLARDRRLTVPSELWMR